VKLTNLVKLSSDGVAPDADGLYFGFAVIQSEKVKLGKLKKQVT